MQATYGVSERALLYVCYHKTSDFWPLVVVLTRKEANNPETTTERGFTQTSSYTGSYKSSPSAESLPTTEKSDIEPGNVIKFQSRSNISISFLGFLLDLPMFFSFSVVIVTTVGIFLPLLIFVSLLVFYKRRRAGKDKVFIGQAQCLSF